MNAISLFSCGGIGDLALRNLGVNTIIANELIPERAEVFKQNYPNTEMIVGDINLKKNQIIDRAKNKNIDILFATPPCQGMSKNGKGTLLKAIRSGKSPKIDVRNLLIIPTIEIVKNLDIPNVIIENVPEMLNTYIINPNDVDQKLICIFDYIKEQLSNYFYDYKIINFADYGIPQSRERLILIFTKTLPNSFKERGDLFPPETHSKNGDFFKKKWVSLREAIEKFPPLDASTKESAINKNIPFHYVPLLDKDKYFWVKNTPENKSAFDNQCISCGYNENPSHSVKRNQDGINRSSRDTPLFCLKCHAILPRPWVIEGKEYRLMKGFTSAYKRMGWDAPASTLTTNFSYACSDKKLHPSQNRVLSIAEAMVLHSLDKYQFDWTRADKKKVSDKLIRELIGESIPPKGLEIVLENFINFLKNLKN